MSISRQAAIDAINSHFGFNIEGEYGSAVQEVINNLPSAQQWTPCSEPPEENEFYLTTIHVHEMNSDFCEKLFYGTPEYSNTNEVGWYFLNGDETTVKVNGVTAWMPLPEPYEPQESEDKK